MDFSLTDEQRALKEEARRWLGERYPAPAWDEADWQELAELGWLGVSTPEETGGVGLGFLEEAILHEELGRALYPGPYFATVALALPALPQKEQEQTVAGKRRWSVEIAGIVPDLDKVDSVLTEEGVVAAAGELLASIDATRSVGRLRDASNSPVPSSVDLPRAWAALACEAVGIAERVLELGVEYASTREQFGKPIGAYQAVAHPLAQTFEDVELARSTAYWAAWCIAEDDEQRIEAAAAAKAFASEVGVSACERSIQVHGGTGFTWEHVLHRYYKRAQWIRQFAGGPAELRRHIAGFLLG